MIVLDTNVVSEVVRERPERAVATWLASRPATSLFITAVTQAELLYGLQLMPEGRRRFLLTGMLEAVLYGEFRERVLPFDEAAAEAYAKIAAERRQRGRPIDTLDAQIAAIARSRGAEVATRNVADFEDCGVELINPWEWRS